MPFQPADNLKNRTFVGLIISQFLAGFNDQAIHIAATFYAIHNHLLSEADAIFLMQILFYAPWAIFCTTSAFLADRFSKTTSIVVWKFAEIVISLILIAGFILGTVYGEQLGVCLVVACVFLMGTHAAFFSPAKYGAMPQILQPHMLSRGNGVLESSTFLANILGLVCGGALFEWTKGQEYWLGIVLLVLSIIGAVSLMMAKLPVSNPEKKFAFFRPLASGFRTVFGSRPLALSVLGIAFFVFVVSYMRATMLLNGQTHNPPWSEFHTSMVVASVALGVGLGSPLAGWLSGGKIELGMVPLGCLGMMLGCAVAAFFLQIEAALVASLLIIGFFSGFYMVPLYAMLQHRSPKTSKGEIVAFSNFVNVTGAMAATALFKVLILLAAVTGLTPLMPQTDNVYTGVTGPEMVKETKHHHVKALTIATEDRGPVTIEASHKSQLELPAHGLTEGQKVIVSKYHIRDIVYYVVRPAEEPMADAYNDESIPEYLFLGAGCMTFAILLLLCWKLPDFFVRMVYWMRSVGNHQLKAVGMDNLPTNGPVILATNCDRLEMALQMISATDRHVVMILAERTDGRDGPTLLRRLAQRSSLVEVEPAGDWSGAAPRAMDALKAGELLGITIDGGVDDARVDAFLAGLVATNAPVLPVWCGAIGPGKLRVVFGEPAPPQSNAAALRAAIEKLKEWIRANDDKASSAH